MKNIKSKLPKISMCVLLLFCIPLTVFAIKRGTAPTEQTGEFCRKTVDRIDFYVENTQFRFKKNDTDSGSYTITFVFSAKKTQSDFYAVINSLKVTGMEYDNIIFRPLNEYCDGLTGCELVLPVKDGEPTEVKWQAELTFSTTQYQTVSPSLEITYTSGMSEQTSDTHILEIPLVITFK